MNMKKYHEKMFSKICNRKIEESRLYAKYEKTHDPKDIAFAIAYSKQTRDIEAEYTKIALGKYYQPV